MAPTNSELVYEGASNLLTDYVKRKSLEMGLTLRETAEVYHQLTEQCAERVNELEEEADEAEIVDEEEEEEDDEEGGEA